MEKIPSIAILLYKIWKKAYWIFHILHDRLDSMENSKKFRHDPKLGLVDQVRQVLQYHHFAYPIETLISHLAVQKKVGASTQGQAFKNTKPHLSLQEMGSWIFAHGALY